MPEYPLKHRAEIRVPFHDVDPMQIVWHGNYARYFEIARCAMLDRIQYNYHHMAQSGVGWPIVKMEQKFVGPAMFNDLLEVECILKSVHIKMVIDYRIYKQKDLITRGTTTQVPVNPQTGEIIFATPQLLIERLQEHGYKDYL